MSEEGPVDGESGTSSIVFRKCRTPQSPVKEEGLVLLTFVYFSRVSYELTGTSPLLIGQTYLSTVR